jgi:hypothetical protein
MTERGGGRWRLRVTGEPDPVTGKQRRLSRTMLGTRSDARQALQRLVGDAGAGLVGGALTRGATALNRALTHDTSGAESTVVLYAARPSRTRPERAICARVRH